MNWRWIAGIVCALYLSVGTVFSAAHDHSNDALQGHEQCAVCAWHHEAVDIPSAEPALTVPEPRVVPRQRTLLHFTDLSAGIHPSRGPPSFP